MKELDEIEWRKGRYPSILFEAVESKSRIMFTEQEEDLRIRYLVEVYKSKIREVYHLLYLTREELKDREMELLAKEK